MWIQIILIGVGLAMDAFAVSICNGIRIQNMKKWHYFVIAFTFAFFQGLMPLIGYYLGTTFIDLISDYDHWLAFALLAAIGLWMVFEGIKDIIKKEEHKEVKFSWGSLIFQGFATSIDALAVGITLTTFSIPIYWDISIIMTLTFIICIIGVILGKQINKLLRGNYTITNIIGGVILISIGIYIVCEHMLGL